MNAERLGEEDAGAGTDSDEGSEHETLGGGGGGALAAATSSWVTRCVCGRNHETDGFMIECEGCEVWQHGACVGVSKNNVPRHYYCEQCKPDIHPLQPAAKKARTKSAKRKRPAKPRGNAPTASSTVANDSKKARKNDPSTADAGEAVNGGPGDANRGEATPAADERVEDAHEDDNKMTREEKKIVKIMQSIQMMEDRARKNEDRRRRGKGKAGGVSSGAGSSSVSSCALKCTNSDSFREFKKSSHLLHQFFPVSPLYLGRKVWLMQRIDGEVTTQPMSSHAGTPQKAQDAASLQKRVLKRYISDSTPTIQSDHNDEPTGVEQSEDRMDVDAEHDEACEDSAVSRPSSPLPDNAVVKANNEKPDEHNDGSFAGSRAESIRSSPPASPPALATPQEPASPSHSTTQHGTDEGHRKQVSQSSTEPQSNAAPPVHTAPEPTTKAQDAAESRTLPSAHSAAARDQTATQTLGPTPTSPSVQNRSKIATIPKRTVPRIPLRTAAPSRPTIPPVASSSLSVSSSIPPIGSGRLLSSTFQKSTMASSSSSKPISNLTELMQAHINQQQRIAAGSMSGGLYSSNQSTSGDRFHGRDVGRPPASESFHDASASVGGISFSHSGAPGSWSTDGNRAGPRQGAAPWNNYGAMSGRFQRRAESSQPSLSSWDRSGVSLSSVAADSDRDFSRLDSRSRQKPGGD